MCQNLALAEPTVCHRNPVRTRRQVSNFASAEGERKLLLTSFASLRFASRNEIEAAKKDSATERARKIYLHLLASIHLRGYGTMYTVYSAENWAQESSQRPPANCIWPGRTYPMALGRSHARRRMREPFPNSLSLSSSSCHMPTGHQRAALTPCEHIMTRQEGEQDMLGTLIHRSRLRPTKIALLIPTKRLSLAG